MERVELCGTAASWGVQVRAQVPLALSLWEAGPGKKHFPSQTHWGQQANLWAGEANLIIKVQQKLRYVLLVIPNTKLWTDVWR